VVLVIYDSHDLSDLERTIRRATAAVRERLDEFDSIVVRGTSGLLVGPTVALRVKKPVVVARKPDDGSHAFSGINQQLINYRKVGKRALFLDDMRSQGTTERAAGDLVRKAGGEITLVYMYHKSEVDRCWLEPIVPPSAFLRQEKARLEREQRHRDNESMRAVTEKLQRSNDARDLAGRYRYRGGEDMYAQMLLPSSMSFDFKFPVTRRKTTDEAKAALEEFERRYVQPAMTAVKRAEIRALFGLEL